MKRWDVFKDGKWVEGIQACHHSEAVLEALRNLDVDLDTPREDCGLDVRLAAQ